MTDNTREPLDPGTDGDSLIQGVLHRLRLAHSYLEVASNDEDPLSRGHAFDAAAAHVASALQALYRATNTRGSASS